MCRNGFLFVMLCIALLILDCSPLFSGESVSGLELPPGPMQAKANTACSECHDTGIIVQQRLNKQSWTKEVDKMVRWGAVVDPKDHDALVDYLTANFGPAKPDYEAPRTRREKPKK